jgi:hypothetical protein
MQAAASSPTGWQAVEIDTVSIPVPSHLSDSARAAYVAEYQAAFVSAFAARRRAHVVEGLLWWVGPVIAVLLLGMAINWVRKGFPRENVPSQETPSK